jgi:hypothetical protein
MIVFLRYVCTPPNRWTIVQYRSQQIHNSTSSQYHSACIPEVSDCMGTTCYPAPRSVVLQPPHKSTHYNTLPMAFRACGLVHTVALNRVKALRYILAMPSITFRKDCMHSVTIPCQRMSLLNPTRETTRRAIRIAGPGTCSNEDQVHLFSYIKKECPAGLSQSGNPFGLHPRTQGQPTRTWSESQLS